MSAPTTVRLNGIRVFGRVGHTEEERIVGNHIEVDVELVLPIDPGREHDLEGTVDYREIHRRVEATVKDGDHPLLEGLASDLLSALEPLRWDQATVTVRKPQPPFGGVVDSAEVEMTRRR